MINLIPSAAKRGILVEYWVRVVSVWLILWAIALIAAASTLLPAYVLISSQVSLHEESASVASQKVSDYETASVALVQASQQARMIVDEKEVMQFSTYMQLLESLQGEGITVSAYTMEREKEGIAPIGIEGVAENRKALASFRDRLLAAKEVSSVDLPISNLAQDKDIQFSLTVVLAKQEQI